MFDHSFITELKQTNISKFPEKTKVRVKEIWKSCKKNVKDTVLGLTGVNDSSYYRIYETGTISAKLALALAQTVGINPYYLTGDVDESGEYTEETGRAFLKDAGYNDLLIEYDRNRVKTRKPRKPSTPAVEEANAAPVAKQDAEENAGWSGSDEDVYVVEEYELPTDIEELPAKTEPPQQRNESKNDVVQSIIDLFNTSYASLSFDIMNSVNSLTAEEVDVLLKSLVIKAKADSEAVTALKIIKLLLLK